jgi:hypothetical protein|tara:strand:- start:777 stop:2870 length:2094 start_codon:yes stop_codon:yes gene_type:complete
MELRADEFAEVFAAHAEAKSPTVLAYEGNPLQAYPEEQRKRVLTELALIASGYGRAAPATPAAGDECAVEQPTDEVSVAVKTSQLSWKVHKSGGQSWRALWCNVKLPFKNVRKKAAFDVLVLALYTPRGVYVYEHDQKLGVLHEHVPTKTATGGLAIELHRSASKESAAKSSLLSTPHRVHPKSACCAHTYVLHLRTCRHQRDLTPHPRLLFFDLSHTLSLSPRYAPDDVTDWTTALDAQEGGLLQQEGGILQQLDSSPCTRLALIRFSDELFTRVLAKRPPWISTTSVYSALPLGIPLGTLGQGARTKAIVEVVRRIDERLDGTQAGCEGGAECEHSLQKSLEIGMLDFKRKQSRWVAEWNNARVPNRMASNASELRLALYTPRGIYLYRHDLKLGVAQQAKAKGGIIRPTQISVYGPKGVEAWAEALDSILRVFDKSSCELLAWVAFDESSRGGGSSGRRELRSAEPRAVVSTGSWDAPSAEGLEEEAGSCLSAEEEEASEEAKQSTCNFLTEWHQRFELWWLSTPHRLGLRACFAALALHLAERLDEALQGAQQLSQLQPSASMNTAGQRLATAEYEDECDFVKDDELLQLPAFPHLPTNVGFEAPPIWRLLPSEQRLHDLSQRAHPTGGVLGSQQAPPPGDADTSIVHLVSVAGIGGALLALVGAVAALRSGNRRSMVRIQRRRGRVIDMLNE